MARRPRGKKTNVSARTAKQAVSNIKRAGRNLRQAGELATAAGHVIAARSVLAAKGLAAPSEMDMGEFARMIPEKVTAFNASGAAYATQTAGAMTSFAEAATAEWIAATGRYTNALATARTPFGAVLAHGQNMLATWRWMIAQSVSAGAQALRAQGAMIAPIHATAQDNARRLAK